jgi:hypothetical protein
MTFSHLENEMNMKSQEFVFFMGVDVQIRKRCSFFVLDNNNKSIEQGWLEGNSTESICSNASYNLLNNRISPEISLNFNNFASGPKDMIDACVSATTSHGIRSR